MFSGLILLTPEVNYEVSKNYKITSGVLKICDFRGLRLINAAKLQH